MRTVYRENFTVEAAGMDRGVTGFRLIGAEYAHPFSFTSFRPALRVRGYRMTRYGWGESEEKENPGIRRKTGDRSWAAGIRWMSEGAAFHLFYEQKREGPPLGEAGLSIKAGGVHFDFSAVYQKRADENTFVFIHAKNIGQSRAIFYNGVTGALLFGFRSRYLYFYFSAKKQNSGRTQRYGNVQFQIVF